jgi:hypothetical protein
MRFIYGTSLAFLFAVLAVSVSFGQNGTPVVTVVDDLAPTSWSDARGHHCPPGWEPVQGMRLCKHSATFDRRSAENQRALEDVQVVTVGRACPHGYRKLGDAICARFVAVSTPDIYTLTADLTYGGAYDNGGEGSYATAPTCNPGWQLVSHPYQGGIGVCLRKVTLLHVAR